MPEPGLEFTFGIEEEFFLVDPETRDIIADPDPGIMERCERESGPHTVVPELLRSQVETNTRVCSSIADLRTALAETRRLVVEAAEAYGARAMAASTHPFAAWREQQVTPKARYQEAEIALQEAVRRFLVGGMHIHAGFGDPDSRLRVMTAIRRHLPLFIALSASSPFNDGGFTGFKSYRPIVIGALPRTGLPGPFRSQAEFDGLVEEYRRIGAIRDSSELRTDIRPSHAYPTIEIRSCDICPRMDESMALAALYASLLRRLLRQDEGEGLRGRGCRPSRGRKSSPRTAGWPNAMERLPLSEMWTVAGESISQTAPRRWWRRLWRTPAPSAARRNSAGLRRSCTTVRRRIGSLSATSFAVSKAQTTRKRCMRWWTRYWRKHAQG